MTEFDPQKIDFDIELNELTIRYVNLKKSLDYLREDESFDKDIKFDVILNINKELGHINNIFKLFANSMNIKT